MNRIEIQNKTFEKFITRDEIRAKVVEMGYDLSKAFKDKNPIFVPVMNGSFMFTADLVRACKFDCELMFVGLSSYSGMQSTGRVEVKFGLEKEKIKGRDIIIIEDIIDTGTTLHQFIELMKNDYEPASVTVVSLLLKPTVVNYDIPMDYIGFRIPDYFVVGYGLDYDGLGRTLGDVYYFVDT